MDIKKYPELKDYELYIKSNSSINTSTSYISDIKTFLLEMEEKYKNNVTQNIKPRDINLYLMSIEGIKSSTRARKRASLSSFFKFLYQNEYIEKDIYSKIGRVSVPKKTNESIIRLNENQMDLMLEKIMDKKFIEKNKLEKVKIRNALIIYMFLIYALRISELRNLKISDIKKDEKIMNILRKGKKKSSMPIDDKTVEMIEKYINEERKGSSEYLFLSLRGNHLSDRYIRNIVYIYTEKIAGKKVSPHKLRATCASYLISQNVSIYLVKEYLDHDSVSTTELYAAHKKEAKKETLKALEGISKNLKWIKNNKSFQCV